MNPKCLLAALLCLFYSSAADAANDSSFARAVISEATNLPLNGWNKTLLLRNGNTVLLHLAHREKMIVKVFDSTHREVSSVSQYFKIVGKMDLETSAFKGFYDIGGIPTLFIMQDIDHHNSLIRVCFSPETGKLIEEKIVFESPGMAGKGHTFYVSKPEKSDHYAVFCFKNIAFNKETLELPVLYFNGQHQQIAKKFLTVPAEGIAGIDFLGFEFDAKHRTYIGILYSIHNINRKFTYGLLVGSGAKEEFIFATQKLTFGAGDQPVYAFFRHNDFSNTLNVTVATGFTAHSEVKSNWYYENIFNTYTGVLGDDLSILSFKQLQYKMGNYFLRGKGDSQKVYNGLPMRMYTNKFGVTTLISEQHMMYPTYKERPLANTSMGNICVTRLNDEGEETDGIIIPKKQHILNGLYYDELAFRGTTKHLFRDVQEQAYDNQFPSFECLSFRNTNYVLVNDYPANMDKALTGERETVMNYRNAEAICYRINADDQLEWQYLFGTPAADESRSLMIESIDQQTDERKFCSLVSVRKGKKVQLHLAWCALN